MECACRESLDQYGTQPSLLRFASAASDDTGFLNTKGSLDQMKNFIMIMVSLMDLHGIKKTYVYTVALFTKNCLSLHDSQWKRA